MQLVDTHCHIHFKDYGLPPEQVLASAADASVVKVICIGCSLEDSELAADFASKYPNVWASAGAHPHDGADYLSTKDAERELARLLKEPKVVAIGEIGLDYFHENAPRADQQKSLRSQIEVGISSGLPFIFHVRDAWDDFWKIYDEYDIKSGVIHSFSADEHRLNEVLERGLYVGLNGIMTFTKDDAQLEAAKKVPLNKLLLETDAPFLTPKPHRGKKCEPKHIRDIAEFLTILREESLEEIAAATTANAERLFNI